MFAGLVNHWRVDHQTNLFPYSEVIKQAADQYPISGTYICKQNAISMGSLCETQCYTAKDLLQHEIMSHTISEYWPLTPLADNEIYDGCKNLNPVTGKQCGSISSTVSAFLWHEHHVHRKKWELAR